MIKISDAVREILSGHSSLGYAFHYKLLNLSQVARFIKPQVEARTQKEVQESALLMAISRLQNQMTEQAAVVLPDFFIDKVSIHSNLCSLTVAKSEASHKALNRLFPLVQEQGGFLTITEGMSEITVIMDDEIYNSCISWMEKPLIINRAIASVTAKFSKRYLNTPGLLYRILHQVTVQNINIIELASTATEFSIFIHQDDVELAFDSIYRVFIKRGRS